MRVGKFPGPDKRGCSIIPTECGPNAGDAEAPFAPWDPWERQLGVRSSGDPRPLSWDPVTPPPFVSRCPSSRTKVLPVAAPQLGPPHLHLTGTHKPQQLCPDNHLGPPQDLPGPQERPYVVLRALGHTVSKEGQVLGGSWSNEVTLQK